MPAATAPPAGRKRSDPKSRPADGRRAYDEVDRKDPNRHYVFANPNDEMTGVDSYLAQGYEVENKRPDGPKARVGKTTGDTVVSNGMVLVSRPMSDHEAEVADGQARADQMDRRILKDGHIEDGLRGQTHRLGVDRNPDITSAPFVELE